VNSERFLWVNCLPEKAQTNRYFGEVPTGKTLFLLEDLRGGRDGRVWKVCDEEGRIGVVKYPTNCITEDKYQAEAERWRSIWEFKDAHVRKLNKTFALVLPFVQPLLPGEEKHEEVRRVTFDAVRSMARQGLRHGDLLWRHVGLRVDAGGKVKRPLEAVLFDLTECSPLEPSERAEAADQMIKVLEDAAR